MGLHPRIHAELAQSLHKVSDVLRTIHRTQGSDAALSALAHYMMGLQAALAEHIGCTTEDQWTDFADQLMRAMEVGVEDAAMVEEAADDYRQRLLADEGQSTAAPGTKTPLTLIKGGG